MKLIYVDLALVLLVCGFVTWTFPAHYKNVGLRSDLDNRTVQLILLQQRYSGLLGEATNCSDTLQRVQVSGQFFYNEALQIYDKWQAERVVSWSLLSIMRDAMSATNATSEYVSVVIPRSHLEEIEAYIAGRNLSYDDMEG